jgi:hypothetical protein
MHTQHTYPVYIDNIIVSVNTYVYSGTKERMGEGQIDAVSTVDVSQIE